MRTTRFKCVKCGKLTVGRMPKGGDGSSRYPARHLGPNGSPCDGNTHEAEWVVVELKGKKP